MFPPLTMPLRPGGIRPTTATFTCRAGTVGRVIGFFLPTDYALWSPAGSVVVLIRSDVYDLSQFEGQFVTACGWEESVPTVEAGTVTVLNVTSINPVAQPLGLRRPLWIAPGL